MIKNILCFSILLFISACAAKKIAIKNAEHLLVSRINKTIPLNEEAQKRVLSQSKAFLNSLKNELYLKKPMLEALSFKEREQFTIAFEGFLILYQKYAQNFSQILAFEMSSLSSKEEEKLFKNLKDENSKIKKQLSKESSFAKRLTLFTGELTPKQNDLIKTYDSQIKEASKQRLHNRIKLEEHIKAVLKDTLSSTEKNQEILKGFVHYNEQQKFELQKELFTELLPTLTKEQLENLSRKKNEILELIDYFHQTKY